MATDLPKPEQGCQQIEPLSIELFAILDSEQIPARHFQLGLVQLVLRPFHTDPNIFLDFRRQVQGDFFFCPPKKKWAYALRQTPSGFDVIGSLETLFKRGLSAERTRHDAMHQAPEVKELILNRRTGQQDFLFAVQRSRRLCRL